MTQSERLNLEGNNRAKSGELTEAVALYSRAIDLDPDYAEPFYNRGKARLNLGQYKTAIADFDRALALRPKNADTFNNRGIAKKKMGDLESAIRDYDMALRCDPMLHRVYLNRGIARLDSGDRSGGCEDLWTAVGFGIVGAMDALREIGFEMTPQQRRSGAIALVKGQHYSEAIPHLRDAIESSPRDWELLYGLAVSVDATNGFEAARGHFDRALETKPDDPLTLTKIGLGLRESGRLEESKRFFFDAATAQPNFESAYVGLALAQRDLREFDKSLHNFDAAAKALARKAALHVGLHNTAESTIYPYRRLGRDLWREHAIFGALFLAASDAVDSVTWPTDEMVKVEYAERQHKGLFFIDSRIDSKVTRNFLPNYFDSFREWLVGELSYVAICQGQASVLEELGRHDEAIANRLEADAFENTPALR